MPTRSRSTHRITKLFPAVALVALVLPASAFGQATRTWVSGVGDDANPCSRTAPCKTFAGAISKTAANGSINVLDPGGFGGVTITKSITIDGENTESGVLVSGTNAIVINAAATDKVFLRGLDVNGLNTGLNGVRILQAKRVKISNSKIYEFAKNGIDFEPGNSGARLIVQNTRIHDNLGNGVLAAPTNSAATATVTLRHVQSDDNGCGATASTFGADPAQNFAANCGAATSGSGISAPAIINSFHSGFDDNTTFGLFARGNKAIQRIADDDVTGNFQGLLVLDSGQILSWKNNFVDGNNTNGAPTGTITPAKKKAHRRGK